MKLFTILRLLVHNTRIIHSTSIISSRYTFTIKMITLTLKDKLVFMTNLEF